jgi:glycosyltransferase involved in cell wall biosynthesis
MNLLMVSGDRSILQGKKGAFWYTREGLSKHWDRIDIITPGPFPEENAPIVIGNAYFHPSPDKSLFKQASWIVRKGRQLIAEHHHNVLTVHEYPPFYNGNGARRLSRETGIPHVLEVHHIVGYPKPASWEERVGSMLSRVSLPRFVRKSAATRVVNESTKKTLVQWGAPAEKIHVVPSFYLDASLLRPDPSVEKTYDVAFCGRLVANKGLMEVLHAIKSLPDVRLLVIGDGPERERATRFIRQSNIDNRVAFVGWLPTQEDVIRALQSAKIFIMNSKSEGGPRVLLEAMACGMPVIATPVGVVPDVIVHGQNGLISMGEPGDLRQKILSLSEEEGLRTRLGTEAQKIVERFERTKLIAAYADFLKTHARRS